MAITLLMSFIAILLGNYDIQMSASLYSAHKGIKFQR